MISKTRVGTFLYAIAYEQRSSIHESGRWAAKPITYLHAESEGEARVKFCSMQNLPTRLIGIGLAVGFYATEEKETVRHSGVRADEVKPVLIA
jgi:hypothetical protein